MKRKTFYEALKAATNHLHASSEQSLREKRKIFFCRSREKLMEEIEKIEEIVLHIRQELKNDFFSGDQNFFQNNPQKSTHKIVRLEPSYKHLFRLGYANFLFFYKNKKQLSVLSEEEKKKKFKQY